MDRLAAATGLDAALLERVADHDRELSADLERWTTAYRALGPHLAQARHDRRARRRHLAAAHRAAHQIHTAHMH